MTLEAPDRRRLRAVALMVVLAAVPWVYPQRYFLRVADLALIYATLALTLVPITRLRGNELAVATLGFGVIVHAVLLNEDWLTEGPFGMMRIPPFRLGPLAFTTEFRFYYLALAVAAGTYFAFRRLTRSRFGRALEAIRQSEDAARTSGINPVLYKSKVFVIGAVTAGLAGALFANLNRYLNPNDFTLAESINILVMIVV